MVYESHASFADVYELDFLFLFLAIARRDDDECSFFYEITLVLPTLE
jgi:hypothetical protein